ncbi:MAG: 1-acyl-sn-glycerol-3-phosphate acyltransferase [Proteobacteria bacterium]|nr:1-acyl-sn-glycerol-3-phosphate acyltransferase [Pseudomonadota bacterium]
MKATRLTYKVINPNKLELKPGHRYIIMSNHNSYYDIPLMCLTFNGSVRMLTKKELFRVPIWGRGLKAGEFIAIDRHNRQQAIKDLEIAKRKMEDGITLWAAPEGSRSRTAKLLPFKKGAFILSIQTGATIIPVGIRGSEKALPPSTWTFFMDQQVDIHIGQPMDVSQYEIEDRDTILREVEKQIRTLSGKD